MPEKTKSRLPNKSLTSAEVAAKKSESSEKAKKPNSETKPQEKSASESAKPEIIKVKTSKTTPKINAKKPSAQKAPKNSTKKSDTSSKTTTIRVKRVAPSGINTENSKKSKTANSESTSAAATTKPKPAPIPRPEPEPKPKPAATKNHPKPKPKKTAKKFSFLSIFSQVIAAILSFTSIFFIGMLLYIDILPMHYLIIAIILILIIAASCSFLLWHQKPKVIIKAPVNIVSIILSCIYLVGGGYIAEASGFLDNLRPQAHISEQYYVIVKNDAPFSTIKDLKSKTIGTYDENVEIYQEAIKKLNDTVEVDLETISSVHAMTEQLLSDKLDAIFLGAVHKSVIDEDSADFSQNTKILYTIEVKVKADSVDEAKVNVTSEPFTIYISGNDSYGELGARGLSDVNMLATVNPVTHEILLTSIPRDCYVQLHGTTGTKDKLTHAGIYGVQTSILTIEELLNINIDYYVKINFPALVNLVDAIDGIDVYSDKTFKPLNGDGRLIYEGVNHFDGKLALAFARERMAYTYGDRHRVQNQRDVLNAIIKKVSSSPVILTKTNEILNSISSNLDTNIGRAEISNLVKLQLQSLPPWRVGEYMVNGSDLYTYTYTFGDQLRYVMPPFPESIQAAHDYITGILEGKSLEDLNLPKQQSWK